MNQPLEERGKERHRILSQSSRVGRTLFLKKREDLRWGLGEKKFLIVRLSRDQIPFLGSSRDQIPFLGSCTSVGTSDRVLEVTVSRATSCEAVIRIVETLTERHR
ncbi:hypothetical protein AVEN_31396-1 [Araneus ventricosus]|uniref:Uncharacterized protein n=1 Tax=Araneus ventricosus TaxID=182803 RepID=A0A4Y2F312_ARAVE|nr:hypothetical protein AVEN_31396-1 [Araneus ventricosus]